MIHGLDCLFPHKFLQRKWAHIFFMFFFRGHTEWCSGLTASSVLSDHSYWCSMDQTRVQ